MALDLAPAGYLVGHVGRTRILTPAAFRDDVL
jgi:hypothetical protein